MIAIADVLPLECGRKMETQRNPWNEACGKAQLSEAGHTPLTDRRFFYSRAWAPGWPHLQQTVLFELLEARSEPNDSQDVGQWDAFI